jgi:hypothetical protein
MSPSIGTETVDRILLLPLIAFVAVIATSLSGFYYTSLEMKCLKKNLNTHTSDLAFHVGNLEIFKWIHMYVRGMILQIGRSV